MSVESEKKSFSLSKTFVASRQTYWCYLHPISWLMW